MSEVERGARGAFEVALAVMLISFVAGVFAATDRYRPPTAATDRMPALQGSTRAPDDEATLSVDSVAIGSAAPARPASGEPLHLAPGQSVTIAGWAVIDRNRSPAGGVVAVIDGAARIAATYGLSRPDVAKLFGSPALRQSGFAVTLPATSFTPGNHVVRFDVLSRDGTAYSQVPPSLDFVTGG